MRKVLVLLLVLAIVAGIVYVAMFERERIIDYLTPADQETEGFTPARTPEGALRKFRDATKARDYETASTYLGGAYAEQMKKAAPAAQALGLAIDDLENSIKPDLMSDQVKAALRLLEPFPSYFAWSEIKKESDNRAKTTITELSNLPKEVRFTHGLWSVDPLIGRALVIDWPGEGKEVELRREGEGKAVSWKIYAGASDRIPRSVARLVERHAGYVKALEGVKKQVVENKFAKPADLELALKRAIEGAR